MKYTRRLQLTGGSTYILSLPSKWIQRLGLTKGSELEITESGEGLKIEVNSGGPQQVIKQVTFASGIPEKYLERALTALYISYFDILTIQSTETMEPSLRDAIKAFSRRVMGVEIFEEGSTKVVLQNVLNSSTFTTSSALRMMALNVENMIADLITAVRTLDFRLLESIMQRDDEVDRYQWYIFRQTKGASSNEEQSVYGLLLSRILERIADHTVNVCSIFLENQDVVKEPNMILISFLEDCYSMFKDATSAFYSGNLRSLNSIIEKKAAIYVVKEKLLSSVSDTQQSHVILTVSEEVDRIGLYSTDIAELGMDYALAGETEVMIK